MAEKTWKLIPKTLFSFPMENSYTNDCKGQWFGCWLITPFCLQRWSCSRQFSSRGKSPVVVCVCVFFCGSTSTNPITNTLLHNVTNHTCTESCSNYRSSNRNHIQSRLFYNSQPDHPQRRWLDDYNESRSKMLRPALQAVTFVSGKEHLKYFLYLGWLGWFLQHPKAKLSEHVQYKYFTKHSVHPKNGEAWICSDLCYTP